MEEKNELRVALDAMNARNSGRDFWYSKDKPVMEWGAVQQILVAAGLKVEGGIVSRTDDPPDCEAVIEGVRCGIEATELVHQEALAQTKRTGQELHFPWGKEDLCRELQARITRKDRPENVKGGPYQRYILVIFTDEFFIDRAKVESLVADVSFHATFITDVFLGLSHDPGAGGCPVFKLRLDSQGS